MAGLTYMVAMAIRDKTLDHETYEYKRISVQPTRYEQGESTMAAHRFKYMKRRMWIRQSKWTGYRPSCSCKTWTSEKWWSNKDLAIQEHLAHAKAFEARNPRLEIPYD
jgi:hypothetical protein